MSITYKDIFLLCVGIAGSLWASFIVGRFILFYQLVFAASTQVVESMTVIRPGTADEKRAAYFASALRIRAIGLQLMTQGHKEAAGIVKAAQDKMDEKFYRSLNGPADDFSGDRMKLFKAWFRELCADFTHEVCNAPKNWYVIFFGFGKVDFSAPAGTPEWNVFAAKEDKKKTTAEG